MIPSLEFTWLDTFSDWIESLLVHQAVLGPILLLTIEESGIPLPIPGEVTVAYTGYNIRRGVIPYMEALIAIMLAILVGSSILFWISSRWGNVLVLKYGKLLHLSPEKLVKVEKVFNKYGALVIIFGRHIPGFRIPITVFAGMSGIKYRTFILSTLISTLFWVMFYLDLGIRLGPKVGAFLQVSFSHWFAIPLTLIIGIIIIFGYRKFINNRF